METAPFDWYRTIFDHVHLRVSDLATSRDFYAAAVAPLGIPIMMDAPHMVAFGHLALTADKPATTGMHIAFMAPSNEAVDAFHAAAVAAGGTDNGAPGPRSYGPPSFATYAAYVLDPDGTNVEAVCRTPIAGG